VNVPFLDLRGAIDELRPELDEAWARVRDSGQYILGEEVAAFESEFARFCGARHCVGVGSGFDALRLLLDALGVGEGDDVLVPAYTAVATWMAATAAGARPVGIDVEESTFNIDLQLVEAAITPRTKAVVAVHLFGRPADMAGLNELAARHDLILLEDAAQAHGADIGGRRVGSLARAAGFSFYPTKNLGAIGDGGAITTDDDDLADRIRLLRAYGWRERSVSEIFGLNSRLDELQAAFLRLRLARLDEQNRQRQQLARRYTEALGAVPGVTVPETAAGASSVWHVYAARFADRAAAQGRLEAAGVGALVHYEPLPHLTPAYRAVGWNAGDFPVAERLAASELSLPLYPGLSDAAVDAVVDALAG
jgi:dTDP-3-amino-3,4,6-trideoxy-alpha-D-glucose transaminase